MKVLIPAEKLAAAVNKHLIPGLIRHTKEQQKLNLVNKNSNAS